MCIRDSLKAIKVLSAEGIPTNCTLIFSANQALLAARAGATYVSPFLGRLDDIGQPGICLLYTSASGHAFFQAAVLLASAPLKIVLLVGLAAWGYLRKTKVA